MKVNGTDYQTVWMENGSVFFIEQNLLPFRFVIGEARSPADCAHAIRTMQVRGAGAIGAMAGYAMAQAALCAPAAGYLPALEHARLLIESTRPTARDLFYAVGIVFAAALNSPEAACEAARGIAAQNSADSRLIGEFGNTLIHNGMRIGTHCNAGWLAFVDYGTALSPVYVAHEQGKEVFVYVDETRPRGQGARLTAWELGQAGVPHTILPDNAGAWLMSLGRIDLMITGADRVAANGDVANKIGTLEKAIAAKRYGVPFYVAAPTSTFDAACPDGTHIPVEERSQDEVLYQEGITGTGERVSIRVASPGSTAFNPAFDVTPAELITGLITEKGIIRPSEEEIAKLLNRK
ncbi:MAG TPA: S-methyl-5-thioribose-1-phosphate isomerase [Bacteroidales bacterium]|nr:S-methyl-5-thioribose-1-phosphate isomerase [Bacteroidales bacterium]HPS62830.1 S-methyl-5-thioribose-1-phosphate isomerase [Bacteroidales bacterium]